MTFPSRWQKPIIDHNKGHLQIISCAGSGKTETLTARIIRLVVSGVRPEEIVAFTFTERAAYELLNRIRTRARDLLTDTQFSELYPRIALLHCSTMHSYCFKLLRALEPSYDVFQIFSPHQEYALLLRLGVSLGLSGGLSCLKHDNDNGVVCKDEIESFLSSLDVVNNEMVGDMELLDEAPKFYNVYESYRGLMERQKILSFGLIIREAVDHLRAVPPDRNPIKRIKYLFVDEYQDTNSAQEQLLIQFAEAGTEICVVGDDDKCIYEWRGSNVANFLEFSDKYKAKVFELPENRRCQPLIFAASKAIAERIRVRKEKEMICASTLPATAIIRIIAEDPQHEARLIVEEIKRITSNSTELCYAYNEIAVLLRSVTTSGQFILNELTAHRIPFRLIGSTALLERPGIDCFGLLLFAWAEGAEVGPNPRGDQTWRSRYRVALQSFLDTHIPSELPKIDVIEQKTIEIGSHVAESKRPDAVKSLMQAIEVIHVGKINPDEDPGLLADIGSMTNLVADVQGVFLRNLAQEGIGDGKALLNDIAWFIVRYAASEYEANLDFDPSLINAVSVCTVHQAKGLEWPVVFIPSLVNGRFPPTGRDSFRFLPPTLYNKVRYDAKFKEDEDPERRLFYVALTRARERLVLSSFKRIKKSRQPSPFLEDIPSTSYQSTQKDVPRVISKVSSKRIQEITCSELIDFLKCPNFYRFRRMFNLQFQLPEELGYSISLHHLVNRAIDKKEQIERDPGYLNRLVEKELHLPYAPTYVRTKLLNNAQTTISLFFKKFSPYLQQAEMLEHDLSLPIGDDFRVSCRPDIVFSMGDGKWIVDLKGIQNFQPQIYHEHQIRAYALALKFIGSAVTRGSFYNFYDNSLVDISLKEKDLTGAQEDFIRAIDEISNKRYERSKLSDCISCDYTKVCWFSNQDKKSVSLE